MKTLPRFTFGMGDRFGQEGIAQLTAVQTAWQRGAAVHPVWNKSNREHSIIGTQPQDVRAEADAAVLALGWSAPYFVDADHINLHTVEAFVACCDFFTLDVADYVGHAPESEVLKDFLHRRSHLVGEHVLPGLETPLRLTDADLSRTADKFLGAIQEAGRIYRHILSRKGETPFAVEISVDETDSPQTPGELLLILAMIADEKIPVQTIAPKFTGRFNKGVDYVGSLPDFSREFEADLAVLAYAVAEFGLPAELKISVHSGSDKFSLYPTIRTLAARFDTGFHLKTAGTTWLEEFIGLAEAGGEALALAQRIYATALPLAPDLIGPYAAVVDIDLAALPKATETASWTSQQWVQALDHDASCPHYLPQLRQFVHVSFKIAAKLGAEFTDALQAHKEIVGRRVHDNLLLKHIEPLFC